ncbi:hypothetical protein [Brevibacillus sp. SYSU BS000544]|uniref:hypothetical protein n=1 Tax=Brevibacillus sp. SYSU BS000544 TaxID=3416443 RepID=UPI003CE458A3
MNKIITILAVMVMVLPLSVTILFSGQDNLLDTSSGYFNQILQHVMSLGTTP